ncbi:MAG TPA: hypothetical protein VH720_02680 [Candidatus Limnocylindrales bacterium]
MRLALVVAVMVALTGCRGFLTPSRTFDTVLEEPAAFDPLPLRVADETGMVRDVIAEVGIVRGPFDGRGALSNPPGQPNRLIVQWVGGACDERTELSVAHGAEGRLHLVLDTVVREQVCNDIGIFRAVSLTLAVPVEASEANLDFARK